MRGFGLYFLLAHSSHSLRVSPCTGAPSQQWSFSQLNSPSHVSANGACLATTTCTPAPGSPVTLLPCNASACPDSADLLWTLDPQGRLTSAASANTLTLTLADVIGPSVNLWNAAGAAPNGEWAWGGAAGSAPGALRTQSAAAGKACLTASMVSVAVLNASQLGRALYGVGGLAAIGGARLIYDYPPQWRDLILELLFAPRGGTAFQVLKTEIEGDMDSSYGSGSSFWHARESPPDFTRGIYLPWLLPKARLLNPGIGTYALSWGMPGWVDASAPQGEDPFLSAESLTYRMKYFEGVRSTYNFSFDLVGVHNERSWSRAFVKQLRAALDAAGFPTTRISVGDGSNSACADCAGGDTTITTAAAADPAFAAALGVIGLHSADAGGLPPLPPSFDWEGAGKDYIQSESNTVDGPFTTLNGEFAQWAPNAASEYGPGLAWPRQFLLSYINGRATGTIICPLSHAWTWLYGRHNHGTALFMQPWSGHFQLGAAFWTQAQFTQATRPGWHFLDGSGSGFFSEDDVVTYGTLVSPQLDAFSVIAVSVDENATTPLAFKLVGELAATFAGTSLACWTSNASALFTQVGDVTIAGDGTFSFSLLPRTVVTLTTLRTLVHAPIEPTIPLKAPFPLPFASNFSGQAPNEPGRFLSDLFGAFEVGPDPLAQRGLVLRQSAPSAPHSWLGGNDGAPFTSLPAPGTAFANAKFSVDALVTEADAPPPDGTVEVSVCGRVPIWQPAAFRDSTKYLGVCLGLNASGEWALVETTLHASTRLAFGALPAPALGAWHNLALSFSDDTVTAAIDNNTVAFIAPGALSSAAGGFGFGSRWHTAAFDAVRLDAAAGHEFIVQWSWLTDLLPGEVLTTNFSGWAGFVLDMRAPGTANITLLALGRFLARGNSLAHALDVLDAATGQSLLAQPIVVNMSACLTGSSDLLGFCYAATPEASRPQLDAGRRYYIVSREEAGGDAFIAMTDAAAATTHAHRDGTTLLSYNGPGFGVVGGKVKKEDGGTWVEEGDLECMYGPLNFLFGSSSSSWGAGGWSR